MIAVVVAAFAIGGLVYGLTTRDRGRAAPEAVTAEQIEEGAPQQAVRAPGLTLVPADDVPRPLTSTPAANPDLQLPDEYQRTDATALPADEYARILEQHNQRAAEAPARPVDPRTIEGTTLPPPPDTVRQTPAPPPAARPAPAQQPSPVNVTRPIPISQPMPPVSGAAGGETVSLVLTIDRRGRVTEVRVVRSVSGVMPQVISAVQRWRFQPATSNGVAVESTFPVEITFARNG